MWYWGGVGRQWSHLFTLLLGIGLAWEYRTHQGAALFVATIGGFIATVWFGLPSGKPQPTEVADAAARLRREVRRIWEDRRALLLYESDGVDVGFGRVVDLEDGSVNCPWGTGSTSTIYDRYRSIPGGRLVIIGEPGSGKTLMAVALVLEMLTQGEHAHPAASVPVPISVSGWNGEQDLGPWLVDRLVEGFRLSRLMARELVEGDYLLPVLDGLDETDPSPQEEDAISRMILKKLRSSPSANLGMRPRPIVMTCRSDFYLGLPGPDRLKKAVVVEAHDIGRDAIQEYLQLQFKSDPAHDPFKSKPFAAAISQQDSCLVTTLGRPWKLSLAVTALRGGMVQPYMLARFKSEKNLSRYLIRAFIPATVSIHPRNRGWWRRRARSVTSRRPRSRRTYRAAEVHRWLVTLAGADGDTRPLAQQIRVQDLWLLGGINRTRFFHTMAAVVAGLLLAALAAELVGGTPGYVVTASTAAVALCFAFWAGLTRNPQPRRLSLGQFLTVRGLPRTFFVAAVAALGAWGGLIDGGRATAMTSGIGATLAAITLVGLVGGIVRAVSPQHILLYDFIFGAIFGLGVSIAAALPGGLTGGIAASLHLKAHLTTPGSAVLAVIIAMMGGVVLGSRSWTRYILMLVLVAPGKQVPWQFSYFLLWCYRAGLLRISGVAYEFRHEELRRYLREFPEFMPGDGS